MKFKRGDILVDPQGEIYEVCGVQELISEWYHLYFEVNKYLIFSNPRLVKYVNESFQKIGVV